MSDRSIRLTVGELRKIISETIQEAPVAFGKHKSASKKDTTDQRAVIDKVREAISDAVTENIKERVRKRLSSGVLTFSDLEIISEPPKTLVRFKDVSGVAGQDMIYLVNVTKIV